MIKVLVRLTGKVVYNYCAFELLVTLDLEIYKATCRLIASADIGLDKLHLVLQRAFNWREEHLYDFAVVDREKDEVHMRLVPDEEGGIPGFLDFREIRLDQTHPEDVGGLLVNGTWRVGDSTESNTLLRR